MAPGLQPHLCVLLQCYLDLTHVGTRIDRDPGRGEESARLLQRVEGPRCLATSSVASRTSVNDASPAGGAVSEDDLPDGLATRATHVQPLDSGTAMSLGPREVRRRHEPTGPVDDTPGGRAKQMNPPLRRSRSDGGQSTTHDARHNGPRHRDENNRPVERPCARASQAGLTLPRNCQITTARAHSGRWATSCGQCGYLVAPPGPADPGWRRRFTQPWEGG